MARPDRTLRPPQRPLLYWTVVGLIALLSAATVVFLRFYR